MDFIFELKLQSVLHKFSSECRECKALLLKIAETMYKLNKDVIVLPEKITLLDLKPAADRGLIKIERDNIAFADETIFLYFLALFISENYALLIYDDNLKFELLLRDLNKKSQQFKHLKNVESMLLLVLNNDFGTDICKRIALLHLDTEKEFFWDLYFPFIKALPYLRVRIKSLVSSLATVLEFIKNDFSAGEIYSSVEKLCVEQSRIGKELFNKLSLDPSSNVVNFIPWILFGISKKRGISAVYQLAFSLIDEGDIGLIQVGILSCSLFDYEKSDSNFLESTIERFSSMMLDKRSEILSTLAVSFGRLIDKSDVVKNKLRELSKKRIQDIKYAIAQILIINMNYFGEQWFKELLLNLSKVESFDQTITDNIGLCLNQYVKNDSDFIFSFFESWIRAHQFDEQSHISIIYGWVFDSLYDQQKDILEKNLTLWLNSDDVRFHHTVSSIIGYFGVQGRESLSLSKPILNNLPTNDIEFIITKILGYVFIYNDYLCQLVFSILQRTPEEEQVNHLVTEAFTNFIAYNYPKTSADYIAQKIAAGNAVEKKASEQILKNIESYWNQYRSLPHLREFEPPESRVRFFLKMKAKQDIKIIKMVKDSGSFRNLATRVVLKGGKTSFLKHDGKYLDKSPLQTITVGKEMARGLSLDPVGLTYLILSYRGMKRIDLQNDTDNS